MPADPYVEHDTLTLLIDLILLKRGVYRHLLYNRGSQARVAHEKRVPIPASISRENVMHGQWRFTILQKALRLVLGSVAVNSSLGQCYRLFRRMFVITL
jgi:hypothetical protein